MDTLRTQTRRLMVGAVPLGGEAPVSVQSMLTTPTQDVPACLAQLDELAAAGADFVRLAIESSRDLAPFGELCKACPLPLVADVHFDHRLAVQAAGLGAAKLRINPGNIGGWAKVDAVIEAAGEAGIPLRVGVNAGSLPGELRDDPGLTLAQKMLRSAQHYVEHFEGRGFEDLVLSAKASDVPTTLAVYRELAHALPTVPLHLGVTEAGTAWQGTIKSAVGIGALLAEGIGNTFRVSLTANPLEEIRVARALLATLHLGASDQATLVSCPTCSRCKVDLIGIAEAVERRLATLKQPLTVAVMGCVVNGPGEASHADVGVACGKGCGALFAKGQVLYTVAEDEIIDALFKEIHHATH